MRRARAGRTLWPMTAGRWERLHERCTNRQSGVVGAWQAVEHGIAGSTFATFARAHGWQALHPGIWAAPGSPEDYSRAVYAALVSLRFGAILTGESALWAAGAVREPRRVVVLVRPRRHCSPRTGVVAYRGAWVAGDRVERRRGFRCAPVLRAVTDHARDSGRDAVVRTLVELDRLREASPGPSWAISSGAAASWGSARSGMRPVASSTAASATQAARRTPAGCCARRGSMCTHARSRSSPAG